MSKVAFQNSNHTRPHPLSLLPTEDLDMIVELVLRSGSLKDLAAEYGVSYPTIRLRVDKLIERLRGAVEGRTPDALTEHLAGLVEQGQLTPVQAREIRDLARAAKPEPAGGEMGGS
ncbi:MAG: DUF2089 family protein [Phycisphaerales bacterium]